MGYKKPEVRGLGHHLTAAPFMTVAQMHRDGWRVRTLCLACYLECWVDFETLIRLNGRDLRLWDRRTRCRRYACQGSAIFQATPPGEQVGLFWPLTGNAPSSSGSPV